MILDVVAPVFDPQEAKFHTSGREDVDVRMLGTGRLFLVELIGPKRLIPSVDDIDQDGEISDNEQVGLIPFMKAREFHGDHKKLHPALTILQKRVNAENAYIKIHSLQLVSK
jgi:tRNA U54 and U55 pseudouridine synthase Pus10